MEATCTPSAASSPDSNCLAARLCLARDSHHLSISSRPRATCEDAITLTIDDWHERILMRGTNLVARVMSSPYVLFEASYIVP